MKKYILFLSVLISCLLTTGCSVSSGCKIDGIVKDVSFEGKTVYLKDNYDRNKVYDSALVVKGKFQFVDSVNITSPYMRLLSLPAHESGAYELPVVMENGHITAVVGKIVCTSVTVLNDKLQDFLLSLDGFQEAIHKEKKFDEKRIMVHFSDFLKGHIITNADNIVGVYLYQIYQHLLTDEDRQSLLTDCGWLKEQVEK